MRTLLFLIAGLLLLASCLVLAKLFAAHYPDAVRLTAIGYVALWFLIAGGNMWVGVAKAGYSIAEELPVFLLIFGVPASFAIVLEWRLF
jgi:hypothetical protein